MWALATTPLPVIASPSLTYPAFVVHLLSRPQRVHVLLDGVFRRLGRVDFSSKIITLSIHPNTLIEASRVMNKTQDIGDKDTINLFYRLSFDTDCGFERDLDLELLKAGTNLSQDLCWWKEVDAEFPLDDGEAMSSDQLGDVVRESARLEQSRISDSDSVFGDAEGSEDQESQGTEKE